MIGFDTSMSRLAPEKRPGERENAHAAGDARGDASRETNPYADYSEFSAFADLRKAAAE